MFQLGAPVYAAETVVIQQGEGSLKETETATIDGANYTFRYDYESDIRTITIVHEDIGHVDTVVTTWKNLSFT